MINLLRTPLWRPFRRIAKDARGVSAVEFAIILPVMLTLYMGGNELGHALTIARKVTHVTSSLGDLVTQAKVLTEADVSNVFDASASVMTPYPTTDLKIKLTGVRIDAAGKAWVAWSRALHDTPLTKDAPFTGLPAAVKTADSFVIAAEVHYPYTPGVGYVMTGTFDLKDQFYLRPRLSKEVCVPVAC